MAALATRCARIGLLLLLLHTLQGCGAPPAPGAAELDPARLEAILVGDDAILRAEQLIALFAELGPDQVRAVRRVYSRLWSYVTSMDAVLLAAWWASHDPEATLAGIRELAFAEHAEAALGVTLRSWARRDPLAARDHLLASGTSYPLETALLSLVRGWIESGDPGVFEFVENFPVGVARQRAIEALADHMVLVDGPDAAVRYVEGLPDDTLKRFKLQFFRRMAAALVLRDPEYAAAWAERHYQSEFGEGVLRHVVGRWTHLDAEASLHWLKGLPPDAPQVEAIELAYSMWLRRDAERALAWAKEQPETPSLEPVRAMYASRIAPEDIETARSILEGIQDPQRRARTTLTVARAWLEKDPAGASAWMSEAGLSDELIAKIRAPAPKRARDRARRRAAPPRDEGPQPEAP